MSDQIKEAVAEPEQAAAAGVADRPDRQTEMTVATVPAPAVQQADAKGGRDNSQEVRKTYEAISNWSSFYMAYQDLLQQTRMADSANDSVNVSWYSFWLGCFTIGLVWLTYMETRKQTRTNRAWVTFKRADSNKAHSGELDFFINNFGGSPAKDVEIKFILGDAKFSNPDLQRISPHPDATFEPSRAGVLPPNLEYCVPLHLTPDVFEHLGRHVFDPTVEITIEITYKTIYGESGHTKHFFEISRIEGREPIEYQISPTDDGDDFAI